MQSSERWVILRNGEFHLARKEGDTWLTTDRFWPSLSTAKRAAEDIGQSISFRGQKSQRRTCISSSTSEEADTPGTAAPHCVAIHPGVYARRSALGRGTSAPRVFVHNV